MKPATGPALLPSERFARFCRTQLQHVKGPLGGQPLILDEWQMRDFVRPIFDNVDARGLRIVREVFGFLPRKNAKTTLIVAICLYQLFSEKEHSPEIVSAAVDKDQASKSFDIAALMVRKSPKLLSKCKITDSKRLIEHKQGGWWKVIPGDAEGALGDNLSTVIIDELLTQKNRNLYSALVTGTAARSQPLTLLISTAGNKMDSFCYHQYDYARKVRDGVVHNPSFLPVIYEASEKDDPHSPKTWAKANPGLGSTVQLQYLQNLSEKAKDDGGALAELLQFHLNRWIAGGVKWINPVKWAECLGKIPMDTDRPKVAIGVDISRRIDLCSVTLAFLIDDDKLGLRSISWTNEGAIQTRHKENKTRFEPFIESGHLVKCEGWEVDYDSVYQKIVDLHEQYEVVTVGVDPYNSGELMQRLEKKGLTVVEFRQRFIDMNQPTKDFQLDILNQRIIHEGDPLLTWSMDNVHILKSPEDEERPTKKHSPEAIDPAVSAIIACAVARRYRRGEGRSIYDQQDMRFLE